MVDDTDAVENAINSIVLDNQRRQINSQADCHHHQTSSTNARGWDICSQKYPCECERQSNQLEHTKQWTRYVTKDLSVWLMLSIAEFGSELSHR